MNQKTRYFLIGSGLVVVVGLCTGVVAYYNGQMPGGTGEMAELSYLPPDAAVVAYADVDGIVNSEFRQRMREFLPSGEEKDRLLEETGIDIERDIDSVVATASGTDPDHSGALVLLRGTFDASRIEGLATGHGATVTEYGGKRLLMAPANDGQAPRALDGGDARPAADGRQMPTIAFLEPTLLALGTRQAVERAIDTAASGQDVTDNAPLMAFMHDIDQTGNAWVVGSFDTLSKTPAMPDEVRSQLPGVEWLAISANVDGGLSGFVRADTVDDAAAENLRQVVAGVLAAARLAGGKNPQISMALDSLQPSGQGRTVQLSFAIQPELIELLRQHVPGAPDTAREPAPQMQAQ